MKYLNASNITITLSFIFFLISGAFTILPDSEYSFSIETIETSNSINIDDLYFEFEMTSDDCKNGCCTCTMGPTGPDGCKDAAYCGMTECEGNCDLGGELCGDCEGCEDPTVPCEA